jgi:hypothetical protein
MTIEEMVIEKIREETKSFWNLMTMIIQPIRTNGTQQRQPKRKDYSQKCIY